jgi:hypothetical protein
MGILIPPESALGKELLKWQQFPVFSSDGSLLPPGNPYVYRPYPKMLYRALIAVESAKPECLQPQPDPMNYLTEPEFQRACQRVEQFNKRVTLIVENESQEQRALADGWYGSIGTALEGYEVEQRRLADEAAARAYRDRTMSPAAQAEADAADAATADHLAAIPERPRKPRDRQTGQFTTEG